MPAKRKRSSATGGAARADESPTLPPAIKSKPPAKRQMSRRPKLDTNPDHNEEVIDGKIALRASPDVDEKGEAFDVHKINVPPKMPAKTNGTNGHMKEEDSESSLSELDDETPVTTPAKKLKKSPTKRSIAAKKGSGEIKAFGAEQAAKKAAETKVKKEDDGDEWDKRQDPGGDEAGPVEEVEALKSEAARPPPVNSEYLPLPWKGRLGYVSYRILSLT